MNKELKNIQRLLWEWRECECDNCLKKLEICGGLFNNHNELNG